MGTEVDFYRNLESIKDYRKICDLRFYREIPESWTLFLCDIEGSTKAIQEGKYKEVNFVGAACIMVALNVLKGVSVPYVFGGDGATLLVPKENEAEVAKSLVALQGLSKGEYDLTLRVGKVSVVELKSQGYSLKVSKYSLSSDVAIALFSGNGFVIAESWVKSNENYRLSHSDPKASVDLKGLECRWKAFPSRKGEILSVLIKAISKNSEESAQVYQEVIEEIELICGSRELVHPISLDNMKLSKSLRDLSVEQRATTYKKSFVQKILKSIFLWCASWVGTVLLLLRIRTDKVDWFKYKKEVIAQSDNWKFDDSLRFVFDLSAAQKRALLACLEAKKREGKVFFGVHSSNAALMTCLIFDRDGDHLHFVDGADGGYALASVQLKESMKVF